MPPFLVGVLVHEKIFFQIKRFRARARASQHRMNPTPDIERNLLKAGYQLLANRLKVGFPGCQALISIDDADVELIS
jgi:hypothetical protein